jgi:hypothetical protein
MHRSKISLIMGSMAVAGLLAAGSAQAQNPVGETIGAVTTVAAAPFMFGGHNYCWYPGGWQGAGWYWCGYAYRQGIGWGGGEGFHGWNHGGPRGGGKPMPAAHGDDHH